MKYPIVPLSGFLGADAAETPGLVKQVVGPGLWRLLNEFHQHALYVGAGHMKLLTVLTSRRVNLEPLALAEI